MRPELANFLFEAANFSVLAVALGWLLFRPVRAALDGERERHAATERAAAEKQAAAEAQAAEARTARAAVEQAQLAARAEAAAEAAREVARARAAAEQDRAAARKALDRSLAESRAAHLRALAEDVGRVAAAAVERLLERIDGPALEAGLIQSALGELQAAEARAPALVESARPLGVEAERLLASALGQPLERRVHPGLGAGVRITAGGVRVDATARGIAMRAAEEVAIELRALEAPAGGLTVEDALPGPAPRAGGAPGAAPAARSDPPAVEQSATVPDGGARRHA